MNAFHFGPPDSPLFGIHHAPPMARDRRRGAVLCQPVGQEYIRSHRTFLQLARQLAGVGWHVLRFDYSGTGDSAGESGEGNLERWESDIAAAVTELNDLADIEETVLVGLRLGADLAAHAAAGIASARRLVLWEPLLDGAAWLAEMTRSQRKWERDHPEFAHGETTADAHHHLLGFPFPEALRNELRTLTPARLNTNPAATVHLIANRASHTLDDFAARLTELGCATHIDVIEEGRVWAKESDLGSLLVPTATVSRIATLLDGEAPA